MGDWEVDTLTIVASPFRGRPFGYVLGFSVPEAEIGEMIDQSPTQGLLVFSGGRVTMLIHHARVLS